MDDLVRAEDVRLAASACSEALSRHADADWSRRAGELEWSCRQTLDHIPNALIFYAAHLAAAAKGRLPRIRDGAGRLSIADLLVSVGATAAILENVVRASPPSARAFHPAGMADPSGFAAMACDEILVHTGDIGQGLGVDFWPPEDLCRRVLARLFPWAPQGFGAWETLLWANGRVSLPGVGRQAENWYWHCAPLSEWDRQVARRASPPGWR